MGFNNYVFSNSLQIDKDRILTLPVVKDISTIGKISLRRGTDSDLKFTFKIPELQSKDAIAYITDNDTDVTYVINYEAFQVLSATFNKSAI